MEDFFLSFLFDVRACGQVSFGGSDGRTNGGPRRRRRIGDDGGATHPFFLLPPFPLLLLSPQFISLPRRNPLKHPGIEFT